jgi:hypothetical protein
MAQTAYSQNQAEAFVGMKADAQFDFVASFIAQADVNFGEPLTRGTSAEFNCKKISALTDKFLGVALHTQAQTAGKFVSMDAVPVLRQGAVWVPVAMAVTAGDPAYVDATGAYTNVAVDEDDDANVSTGGTFVKTTTGAGITVLEFNATGILTVVNNITVEEEAGN